MTGVPPLELLAGRGSDLLVRVAGVACSDRELPRMAENLAELVVRSARALTFCDVYVLDEEERVLEWRGAPVPLGEGEAGRVAAHGRARTHPDGRGAAVPVHGDGIVIAVVDVRSAGPCPPDDLALVTALAGLFAPVLSSCRRLRTAREREHAAERFAERAVEAQEAERSRLSREIHDGIAQRLASLGFHLSAAERALPEHHPEGLAQIMMARRLCELAAAETRAAIGGLRPPVLDDLGLSAALATLAREAGDGSGAPGALDVTVTVEGELEEELPDHVQTALYRIAQEAVGNSLRHASADRVDLLLEHSSDRVRLKVADDGSGFSMRDVLARGGRGRRPDSYGLRGMRERAELLGGRVAVTSRPGVGTTVEAVIPIPGRRRS
ncbi:GAF domain-containing sensor histidine kinase [Actinomadura citrea]|uniref:histidine kinase n=1 Tax=Actinomadura citrea TaxID=46158 RepID=A0A7Y9GG87_9ACTN|nr:GAF domain-containing sensor histidine kinase [Actinomadura citrea]NYE15821.1 signal transduction histidine kinase [Actinomadura citrea]GGT67356.1 sensor histidine kinase [Actinomadura citrea]